MFQCKHIAPFCLQVRTLQLVWTLVLSSMSSCRRLRWSFRLLRQVIVSPSTFAPQLLICPSQHEIGCNARPTVSFVHVTYKMCQCQADALLEQSCESTCMPIFNPQQATLRPRVGIQPY